MSDDATKGTEKQDPQGTGAQTQNENDLPGWARKAISDANAEAARYRVKANEVEAQTRSSVSAEFSEQLKAVSDEKSAIAVERDTSVSDYMKLKTAIAAGVPGDTAVEFAALLKGNNEDEYKAHAEKLMGMFGSGRPAKAVDPSHGANTSGAMATTDDAWVELMKQAGIK
jgi:hypothetical protein